MTTKQLTIKQQTILNELQIIIAKTTLKEITYTNLAKLIISKMAERNEIILKDEVLEIIVNKLIDFYKNNRRCRLMSIPIRNIHNILYSLDITYSKDYQNDIDYLEKINKENKLPNQQELTQLMIICLNLSARLDIYLQL